MKAIELKTALNEIEGVKATRLKGQIILRFDPTLSFENRISVMEYITELNKSLPQTKDMIVNEDTAKIFINEDMLADVDLSTVVIPESLKTITVDTKGGETPTEDVKTAETPVETVVKKADNRPTPEAKTEGAPKDAANPTNVVLGGKGRKDEIDVASNGMKIGDSFMHPKYGKCIVNKCYLPGLSNGQSNGKDYIDYNIEGDTKKRNMNTSVAMIEKHQAGWEALSEDDKAKVLNQYKAEDVPATPKQAEEPENEESVE